LVIFSDAEKRELRLSSRCCLGPTSGENYFASIDNGPRRFVATTRLRRPLVECVPAGM